jgi:acyl carrier protein
LDYVDLVVVIENNFGFKVKGEDFIDIVTFDDFYKYVSDRVAARD